MIFGFARIYLCKRLAKSELKLANWKLGFQFSYLVLTVYNDKSIMQNDKKSCHYSNESCQINNKSCHMEV